VDNEEIFIKLKAATSQTSSQESDKMEKQSWSKYCWLLKGIIMS